MPISELIKQIKWPTGKDLIGLIPIVHWLPRYQFKANFATDVIGGLTMGAVMVPQGMRKCYQVVVLWWLDSLLSGIAYGELAGLPASYGLYTSFIAAILYVILGQSPHVSMGMSAA